MAFRDLGKRCLRPLNPRERPRRPARLANFRDDQQFTRPTGCDGFLQDQPEDGRVFRLKLRLHKPFETVPGDELPVPRKPCHHDREQSSVVGARPGCVEKEAFEIRCLAACATIEEHPDPCPIPLDVTGQRPGITGAGVGMASCNEHADMIPRLDRCSLGMGRWWGGSREPEQRHKGIPLIRRHVP